MMHLNDWKRNNEDTAKGRGTAAVLTLFALTMGAGMAFLSYQGDIRNETVVPSDAVEVRKTLQSDTAGYDADKAAVEALDAETLASESAAVAVSEAMEIAAEGNTEAIEEAFSFDYADMTPAAKREFLQNLMSENARETFAEAEAAAKEKAKDLDWTSLSTNPQLITYLTGSYHPNDRSLINAKRACHYLNGTVVAPGEEFSYNAVLGERTTSRGYVMAPSITSADMEYTVGGGICQISSLLYQVCLQSNMKIVERHPHTLIVPYADNGFDASVVWGQWDFRFRNPYDYPVMILAYSEDASRSVSIFLVTDVKDPLDGKTYEMVSEQTGDYSFHNYIDISGRDGSKERVDLGSNSYWGIADES